MSSRGGTPRLRQQPHNPPVIHHPNQPANQRGDQSGNPVESAAPLQLLAHHPNLLNTDAANYISWPIPSTQPTGLEGASSLTEPAQYDFGFDDTFPLGQSRSVLPYHTPTESDTGQHGTDYFLARTPQTRRQYSQNDVDEYVQERFGEKKDKTSVTRDALAHFGPESEDRVKEAVNRHRPWTQHEVQLAITFTTLAENIRWDYVAQRLLENGHPRTPADIVAKMVELDQEERGAGRSQLQ